MPALIILERHHKRALRLWTEHPGRHKIWYIGKRGKKSKKGERKRKEGRNQQRKEKERKSNNNSKIFLLFWKLAPFLKKKKKKFHWFPAQIKSLDLVEWQWFNSKKLPAYLRGAPRGQTHYYSSQPPKQLPSLTIASLVPGPQNPCQVEPG